MILTWFANLDGELPRDSQQLHGLVAAEFPNEGRVLYAVPDWRIIAVQHRHPIQRSVTPLGLVMEERSIDTPHGWWSSQCWGVGVGGTQYRHSSDWGAGGVLPHRERHRLQGW